MCPGSDSVVCSSLAVETDDKAAGYRGQQHELTVGAKAIIALNTIECAVSLMDTGSRSDVDHHVADIRRALGCAFDGLGWDDSKASAINNIADAMETQLQEGGGNQEIIDALNNAFEALAKTTLADDPW